MYGISKNVFFKKAFLKTARNVALFICLFDFILFNT